MPDSDHGTPYPADDAGGVDDWSRAVFEACREWPLAASGRWFRTESGWLLLRIEAVDGEPLEPLLAVELDTADGQINLDLGSWYTPVCVPGSGLRLAAAQATAEARALIEGWFRSEVKLASYSDDSGWRGSKIIRGGKLPAAIEPVPVGVGAGGRVAVKSWRRRDWSWWRQAGDGNWVPGEPAGD